MKDYIKGTYNKTIFQSNSGYYIGLFKVKEANSDELKAYINKTITITGYFHELNNIDTYMFYGKLINHEKYGEQFQVESYERLKPEEKDSIIEFLTSGLFKGIGEKKATAIVGALGKDTLKKILEEPNNLILIQGITKKDADTLYYKLREYEESYEIIIYLQDIGFTTKDSMLIYNTYKKDSKKVVNNNIYQLIEDILEINFKKIDSIALKNGMKRDSKNRIMAAIIYIMNEVSNTYGHCYYFYDEIFKYLVKVLGCIIPDDLYIECLNSLIKDLKVIAVEDRYYLKEMYEAETFIVKRLRLLNSNKENKNKKIDDTVLEIEKLFDIKYNCKQLEAIKKSYLKDLLIITGGPGTGKTTIMKAICELYRQINKYSYKDAIEKMALLAPTGRAAKRMSEATMYPASTIHRFLKWNKDTNHFQINQYNKSKAELVILDEASMIDTYLFANLLKGISSNCRIIIVGDNHQLPSVGPGQVLNDLIESNALEVVELNELYRQAKNSNIINLAYDIRNETVDINRFNKDDDLTFIECSDKEVLDNICEITNTYKDLSYKQIQILAPMYKGINGIDEINKKVQEIYNPKNKSLNEQIVGEELLRERDKVIQLTNMPDDNVYNGDIGIIDTINNLSKKEIILDFDSNIVKYSQSNYGNFKLAYAISIHKSQGSEFDIVILPMIDSYKKMLYQRLIYTAVTRAKKRLFIIGNIESLKYAAKNTEVDLRRTTIKKYLIEGIK